MSTPGTIRKTHVLVLLSGLFLAHPVYTETCLWKARSPKGMLYVLGSIHVLKPENYPLPSIIEAAYTESSNIVFEVDMQNMMSPQTQQLIMTKALLQVDVTLESLLSQEVYKSIEEELSALGLP
ncbi:MAG: TraB/GumN family protein, partial [Kiritimatiellales bacterium]|nr:TraB/GumN family protein [Kiritimatiellales bacterium]